MTHRGDIVIVQFPYQDGGRGKNRPALVLQCDRNNRRLQNTFHAGQGEARRLSYEIRISIYCVAVG